MKRTHFDDDREVYRETVREFLAREIEPNYERWEEERLVDRSAWIAAGKSGIVGLGVPEEFGGSGVTDYRFRHIVQEEIARTGTTSFGAGLALQDDIAIPYILHLGTEDQKARWLPALATGERIGAIAMTEPGAGSDLQGVKTTAVREGDEWVINGQKTFITNGIHSDLVIVVCRTDPNAGSKGFSLIVVERDTPANGCAVEFARHRIRVNSVLPGRIATDMTGPLQESDVFNSNVIGRVPLGRWGTPEDFEGIAVYLASDASSFQAGSTTLIDGGYSMF